MLEANSRGKGGNGVPCCTYNHIINQRFEYLPDAFHVITSDYLAMTDKQLLPLPLPPSEYMFYFIKCAMQTIPTPSHLLVTSNSQIDPSFPPTGFHLSPPYKQHHVLFQPLPPPTSLTYSTFPLAKPIVPAIFKYPLWAFSRSCG